MRIAARMALAAGLMAAFIVTTTAQERQRQGQRGQGGGGFGFGGGGGVFAMLVTADFQNMGELKINKALQEELKITDEQGSKLKEVMKPIQEARMEMFKGITPGERPSEEQMKAMREKGEKLTADTKKAIEGAIKPEQFKRLTQISYQQMGVNAYSDKDVQTALKFTDEQKEKIKAIADEYNKDSREIRGAGFQRGGGGDREEIAKKMQENQKKIDALTKEATDKINDKLTDDQKKAWKDMQGEKYDLAKLVQRPMRRDN